MASPATLETTSEIFETYEREFQTLSAEVSRKIQEATSGTSQTLEQRKAFMNATERELDESEEIISQMEMELLSLAPAIRVKLQPRVKAYKQEVEKMNRELKKAIENADRTALLGPDAARVSNDADIATQDQRTRLLNGTERLQESSKRLENAHRVALETEQIGQNTLGTLYEQREQILRTRDTLSTADSFIATSQRILKGMQRRMLTNKLITAAVIVALVLLIILIIWLKYF